MSRDLSGRAPLYELLKKNSEKQAIWAHMPGHGGKACNLRELGAVAVFDTTETVMTDNVYMPGDCLSESYRLLTKLYKSKASVFSCGGATLAIQAMLYLACGFGGEVIVDRRAHKSVMNTAILLGLDVKWLAPTIDKNETAQTYIEPLELDRMLTENARAKAVLICSPTYFGSLSDISALARVCERHDVKLLVDNAHGAHLIALEDGRYHPIVQGAHFVADSAHKTLPAFTGGAFLHSSCAMESGLLEAMALFGSTSPSFLIAASLDLARAYLESDAKTDIQNFLELKEHFSAQLSERTPFSLLENCKDYDNFANKHLIFDPLRVIIKCDDFDAREILLKLSQQNIICEMANRDYLVLILPLSANWELFLALIDGLESCTGLEKCDREDKAFDFHIPKRAMTLREAMGKECEEILLEDAVGRICASDISPYPPGIPVIVAGEVFDREIVCRLSGETVRVRVIKT